MKKICKNCKYRDCNENRYKGYSSCNNKIVEDIISIPESYTGWDDIHFNENFGCIFWEKKKIIISKIKNE